MLYDLSEKAFFRFITYMLDGLKSIPTISAEPLAICDVRFKMDLELSMEQCCGDDRHVAVLGMAHTT